MTVYHYILRYANMMASYFRALYRFNHTIVACMASWVHNWLSYSLFRSRSSSWRRTTPLARWPIWWSSITATHYPTTAPSCCRSPTATPRPGDLTYPSARAHGTHQCQPAHNGIRLPDLQVKCPLQVETCHYTYRWPPSVMWEDTCSVCALQEPWVGSTTARLFALNTHILRSGLNSRVTKLRGQWITSKLPWGWKGQRVQMPR